MSANRPKRRRPNQPPILHDNNQWSIKEKRRMQRALLKYNPHDIDKIAKLIESKKVGEVKAYLDKLEEKLKIYAENRPKEIIEHWTTLASDLISCEAKDYSEVLSNVMSIISNLEERVDPSLSTEGDSQQPDYASIYKYIATILKGHELPFLGKLESAIVLDLMHNLIDTIRTHDTSKQEEIMLQKYQLLNSKIDIKNTMAHVERCRKAINNDFSDFQKQEVIEEEETTTANCPVISASTHGPPTSKVTTSKTSTANCPVTSTSTHRPSTSKVTTSKKTKTKTTTAIMVSPSPNVFGRPIGRKVEGNLPTELDFFQGPRKRGRPKSKDPYDRSNILIPEKKSKSSLSTDNETDIETPQNLDNKDSENQPGPSSSENSDKVIENQTSSSTENQTSSSTENQTSLSTENQTSSSTEIQTSLSTENSNQVLENQPGPSCSDTSNKSKTVPHNTKKSSEKGEDHVRKEKEDFPKKKEEIPKKPALFTLNPLCIPIDLLKFKRLVSSDVTFKPVMRNYQMVQRIVPRQHKERMKKEEQKNPESEVELICVDEKKDVIRREKYISIIRDEHDADNKF